MTVTTTTYPSLLRAQRAIRRGLEGLNRKPPAFTDPTTSDPGARASERDESRLRAHLEVLDGGRELIAIANELERKADLARTAGVEALRHAHPPVPWAQIGDRLGMTAQGAHKRFRFVDEPEAELTLDEELARTDASRPPAPATRDGSRRRGVATAA